MSCDYGAHKCSDPAQTLGVNEPVGAWAEGRKRGGHCPRCGGFLTEDGVCNNPRCGTGDSFAMAMGKPKPDKKFGNRVNEVNESVGDLVRNKLLGLVEDRSVQAELTKKSIDITMRLARLKELGDSPTSSVLEIESEAEYIGFQLDKLISMALGKTDIPDTALSDGIRENVRTIKEDLSTLPVLARSGEFTTPGHCPQCGAGLSVNEGETDWCLECEEMVGAVNASLPAPPATSSGGVGIEQYAEAARKLQDATSSPKRNTFQLRVKSIGYEKVKLALRSVGVPGTSSDEEAAKISNMVWQYLDRCPRCKAWISPREGICRNPRCGKEGKKVGEMRPWPPVRVSWVGKKEAVGKVLRPASTSKRP